MSLISLFLILFILILIGYFLKKRANGPLNPLKKDFTGKLIIITGCSDGIGLVTAKDLLNSNATVIFACRNKTKTEEIINSFPEKMRKNSIFVQLNLSSFKSIKNFADEIKSKYKKIDILINNAGVSPFNNIYKTEDGYLNAFQVNYLGNVLLTLLLMEHFNEKESKIINVSSQAHKWSKLTYGDSKYLNDYGLKFNNSEFKIRRQLYPDSKLLLNYFTQYLGSLAEEKYPYLKVVCLHPGRIFTNIFTSQKNIVFKILFNVIFRSIWYFSTKDVIHGAQTTFK